MKGTIKSLAILAALLFPMNLVQAEDDDYFPPYSGWDWPETPMTMDSPYGQGTGGTTSPVTVPKYIDFSHIPTLQSLMTEMTNTETRLTQTEKDAQAVLTALAGLTLPTPCPDRITDTIESAKKLAKDGKTYAGIGKTAAGAAKTQLEGIISLLESAQAKFMATPQDLVGAKADVDAARQAWVSKGTPEAPGVKPNIAKARYNDGRASMAVTSAQTYLGTAQRLINEDKQTGDMQKKMMQMMSGTGM